MSELNLLWANTLHDNPIPERASNWGARAGIFCLKNLAFRSKNSSFGCKNWCSKHFGKPPTLSTSPHNSQVQKKKATKLFLSTGHWSVLRNNVVAFFCFEKKKKLYSSSALLPKELKYQDIYFGALVNGQCSKINVLIFFCLDIRSCTLIKLLFSLLMLWKNVEVIILEHWP